LANNILKIAIAFLHEISLGFWQKTPDFYDEIMEPL